MAKRILVVEDNYAMLNAIIRHLDEGGYHIVGYANNGKDAIDKYKELLPDAVTLDLVMPLLDGIEAARQIKRFDPWAKIVVCSSVGEKTVIKKAFLAGADEFVPKPIISQILLAALKRLTS